MTYHEVELESMGTSCYRPFERSVGVGYMITDHVVDPRRCGDRRGGQNVQCLSYLESRHRLGMLGPRTFSSGRRD